MTTASVDDVAERLGRPLNPDETLMVDALLEDAEAEIKVWGAGSRLTDPLWHQNVIKVECDMVIRAAGLAAKTTQVIPQLEDIDRMDSGTPSKRPNVYLSRFDRRSLGLKLNSTVRMYPRIPYGWDYL